jgi:hypothetical protein
MENRGPVQGARCRGRHPVIRSLLRRPVLSVAGLSAAVAVAGGAYAATGTDDAAPAASTMDAALERAVPGGAVADGHAAVAQAQASVQEAQLEREAARRAEAERAARLEAERQAQLEAERLAAEEAARQAEAQRQAQLEAERRAEAARQAEAARLAAAEQVSRAADRDPRSTAQAMLAQRGWADQFGCLEKLWQRESRWDHTADNPTSSAYGIPQALPGSRMASAGPDWRTNPETQIRWGLDYIAERYGSPCAALNHSNARNWY